jgi:hypothetical protein
MGQFTTMSASANQSFIIVKYLLLFLIVLNILSTIWVGIYNKNSVDEAEMLYPDDRHTGDKGEGSKAQLWEKLCITFLVFQNIANVMGIFGTLQENYCISIIYSIIMFGSSLYGSAAEYMRGSVCSYLMPFIVAVVALIFAHQIRMENYEPANTDDKTVTTPIYKAPPLPPKPKLPESRSPSLQQENKTNGHRINGSVTEV